MELVRRSSETETEAVGAFWRWWSVAGAGLVTAAVMTGVYGDLPEIIGAMVMAIHPELRWETGPGARSRHRLCVSGAGDPRLRVTGRAVAEGGSPAHWSRKIAAAKTCRQPGMLTGTLEGLEHPVDLGLARVAVDWDERSALAELTVFHPAFTMMGTNDCRQAGRLLVDWLLGEDDVQRWVGAINVTRADPRDSQPAAVVPEFFQAVEYPEPGPPMDDARGQNFIGAQGNCLRPAAIAMGRSPAIGPAYCCPDQLPADRGWRTAGRGGTDPAPSSRTGPGLASRAPRRRCGRPRGRRPRGRSRWWCGDARRSWLLPPAATVGAGADDRHGECAVVDQGALVIPRPIRAGHRAGSRAPGTWPPGC